MRPQRAAHGPAVARWQIWEGELTATDPERDGVFFDDYLVRMRGGQTRLISVEAGGFDPVAWVLSPNAREGEPIDMDDDAGPGTNALLGFRAEADGDYIVRVTSYALAPPAPIGSVSAKNLLRRHRRRRPSKTTIQPLRSR